VTPLAYDRMSFTRASLPETRTIRSTAETLSA
jgi:hypothetical protein